MVGQEEKREGRVSRCRQDREEGQVEETRAGQRGEVDQTTSSQKEGRVKMTHDWPYSNIQIFEV
jgi:hypothetical protein